MDDFPAMAMTDSSTGITLGISKLPAKFVVGWFAGHWMILFLNFV